MSVTPQQEEAIDTICDLRDIALMCGADKSSLNEFLGRMTKEFVIPAFSGGERRRRECTDGRRSTIDWSLATPRPSEDEWYRLKAAVFRRDGFICTYCGDTETKFTADHVVPLSRGGTNDLENLVSCCVPCNNSKRHFLLSEWRGRGR